jgi:hypothetical protein
MNYPWKMDLTVGSQFSLQLNDLIQNSFKATRISISIYLQIIGFGQV